LDQAVTATVIGPMSLEVGDLNIVVSEHNLEDPARAKLYVLENVDGRGLKWVSHISQWETSTTMGRSLSTSTMMAISISCRSAGPTPASYYSRTMEGYSRTMEGYSRTMEGQLVQTIDDAIAEFSTWACLNS
jgi:hypothetical protein